MGIGRMIGQFLANDLPNLRRRIQERLSLLKYLVDSLKFKSFAEIQLQILKQWKKNAIFLSINTIWMVKMQAGKLTSLHSFLEEYRKQATLIANLTHFYFKDALVILDAKNNATFYQLQQDTAHKILNSLRDWQNLYKYTFIPLLKGRNLSSNSMMEMHFDPKTLNINPQYLDTQSGRVQLVQTTQKIRQFSSQCSIHSKIELLKEIRATFIKEIERNREEINKKNPNLRFSTLEKDDIIGCIIYCIISGQISEIQESIQGLFELLGPNNELLSRKGVDSYRADLASAVEYLCQQSQARQSCKLQDLEKSKVQMENESTQLQSVE